MLNSELLESSSAFISSMINSSFSSEFEYSTMSLNEKINLFFFLSFSLASLLSSRTSSFV